jgi:hypothetical protein
MGNANITRAPASSPKRIEKKGDQKVNKKATTSIKAATNPHQLLAPYLWPSSSSTISSSRATTPSFAQLGISILDPLLGHDNITPAAAYALGVTTAASSMGSSSKQIEYPHGADRLVMYVRCRTNPLDVTDQPSFVIVECIIPRVPRDMPPPVFEPLGHPASPEILRQRESIITSWLKPFYGNTGNGNIDDVGGSSNTVNAPHIRVCSHIIGTSPYSVTNRCLGSPFVSPWLNQHAVVLITPYAYHTTTPYQQNMEKEYQKRRNDEVGMRLKQAAEDTKEHKVLKPLSTPMVNICWIDPITLHPRPLLHSLPVRTDEYLTRYPSLFDIHYVLPCGSLGWIIRFVLSRDGPYMWAFIDAQQVKYTHPRASLISSVVSTKFHDQSNRAHSISYNGRI